MKARRIGIGLALTATLLVGQLFSVMAEETAGEAPVATEAAAEGESEAAETVSDTVTAPEKDSAPATEQATEPAAGSDAEPATEPETEPASEAPSESEATPEAETPSDSQTESATAAEPTSETEPSVQDGGVTPAENDSTAKEEPEDASTAEEETSLSVQASNNLYDEVTRDEVRIAQLVIDEIVDGTGPWDADNNPGNDADEHNKIVRSYDTVVYALHYTTEAKTLGDNYKHGWIYCEATLPVSPDKATFDLNAIERDYPDSYTGPREVVYENGVQKLVWFRERVETRNAQGEVIEPLPNEGTFPVTVNVLGAQNGDTVQPEFTLSVAYLDEADGGALKTEGSFDVPKSVKADPVKVSAAPKYNVKIEHDGSSENFNGTIDAYDFSTGNGASAEYPALYRDKGTVYGKMISVGVTLQLYNDSAAKGLKGIEAPTGPITFDLDMSATFPGQNGNTVDTPLIWSYGPQINGKTEQQDGRDVKSYVATNADYAVYESPRNTHTGDGTAAPATGTNQCWDGGTWHMAVDNSDESKVHVTVDNYSINMDWFPNSDLGNAATTSIYYNPANGMQNIGCFSGGQIFVIVPFGGSTDTTDPDFYPTKYGQDGNVNFVMNDSNLQAKGISGQSVNGKQMETGDDRIETAVVLTRPGTRVNRVFYQALNRYGAYTERGINDTYAAFLDGSDVAVLGQEISTCWGIWISPYGTTSQSANAVNALLKFDPTVMDPTGEMKANQNSGNSLYPEPASTTFLYGFKKDGSAWTDQEEMNRTTEEDLVFYDSPTAGGICVAILAEARDYPAASQQERLSFSAKFKVKTDPSLVGNAYALTSGSYVWTEEQVEKIKADNGGNMPTRANGADYGIGETPRYESYYSSHRDNYEFEPASYDDAGYHAGNGNYIYGDTLYIVGYQTKITKNVEQGNGADTPKPTVSFSLSKNQSIVDYVLKPDFDTPAIQGVDYVGQKTELIVQDILPAGVDYIAGSAYVGGTWKENEEYSGRSDSKFLHGSIEGGTAREPDSILYNEDGTTTLTWKFPDTEIGTLNEDHWIHFSANLPQAITRTTSYVNTTTVGSTEDQRAKTDGNGNLDTATIQVSPASDLVCTKEVDHPFLDVDGDMGFTLRWNNTAPAGSFDNVMMDTMPSSGQNNSDFSGGHTVVEAITITPPSGKKATNYSFYYTTDAAASEQRASLYQDDYKAGKFTGNTVTLHDVTWTKAEISQVDEKTCEVSAVEGKAITAFILLGKIDKLEELSAHVLLQTEGNEANDLYVNMLSANLSTTTRSARVADRVLAGIVWIDSNLNGSSEETASEENAEKLVEGVRVNLLKKNAEGVYEPVLDRDGNPRFALTDENGHYEFHGVSAGTFRVEFTNAGTSLAPYLGTLREADGVDTLHNSNATVIYGEEIFGYIEDIELPTIDQIMSSPYPSDATDARLHLDLGLYQNAKKSYNNEDAEETWEDGKEVQVGDVIPYQITFANVELTEQKISFSDTFSVGLSYQDDIQVMAQDADGNEITIVPEEAEATENEDGSVTYVWTLPDVPSRTTGRLTYSAEVTNDAKEPLQVRNHAQVCYDEGPWQDIGDLKNPLPKDPNTESKQYAADSAGMGGIEVEVGTEITYEITFTQNSNEPEKIVITDMMSPGLIYQKNAILLPEEARIENEVITENADGSTTIIWTLEEVPRGTDYAVYYSAAVSENTTVDRVSNRALISHNEEEPIELDELINPIIRKEPAAEKRYAKDSKGAGGATVQKGMEIAYEIAFNQVKKSALKVEITDTMSKDLLYQKGSAVLADGTKPDQEVISGPDAEGRQTVVWTFDALDTGDYVLSYTAQVSKETAEESVTNAASIRYNDGEPITLETLINPLPKTAVSVVRKVTTVKPSPKTADSSRNGIWAMLLLLGAGAAVLLLKKRARR